jgi:hypothetical protein
MLPSSSCSCSAASCNISSSEGVGYRDDSTFLRAWPPAPATVTRCAHATPPRSQAARDLIVEELDGLLVDALALNHQRQQRSAPVQKMPTDRGARVCVLDDVAWEPLHNLKEHVTRLELQLWGPPHRVSGVGGWVGVRAPRAPSSLPTIQREKKGLDSACRPRLRLTSSHTWSAVTPTSLKVTSMLSPEHRSTRTPTASCPAIVVAKTG